MTKYRIIVDMYENKSESRMEWEFESPVLCSLENISDELVIKQGKLRIIKKIGITEYNKYFVKAIPEEFDVELTATKNIVFGFEDTILLFQGVNYISIENLKSDIFIQYIINSPFTDGLAMQSDLKAELAIKNAEISAKVSKNEIISEINLSPEVAKIQAEKIKLEGYTTINGGFSVDLQGNMSCQDATINGGLVVGTGLYSCLVFTPTVSAEFWEDYSSIGGLQKVGYYIYPYGNYSPERHYRVPVVIPFHLPNGFEVTEANLFVEHQTVKWDDSSTISKAEGLRVYLNTLPPQSSTSINFSVIHGQEAAPLNQYFTNQVSGVWADGSNGRTFANGYRTEKTRDFSNYIRGMQSGTVAIAPVTSYVSDYKSNSSLLNAKLYIYGYLKRGQ